MACTFFTGRGKPSETFGRFGRVLVSRLAYRIGWCMIYGERQRVTFGKLASHKVRS